MSLIRSISVALLVALFSLTLGAANANPNKVFYLDLKRGCYAGNSSASPFLEWSGPDYKTLYKASCNGRYHYQVYAITKLSVEVGSEAAQEDASDTCVAALARRISLSSLNPKMGMGWFFPDEGVEDKKYKKKLICFLRMPSPSDYNLSVVQKKPLI